MGVSGFKQRGKKLSECGASYVRLAGFLVDFLQDLSVRFFVTWVVAKNDAFLEVSSGADTAGMLCYVGFMKDLGCCTAA